MSTHCYFIDVDSTIAHHGTNDFFPGAMEKINALHAEGHQIWLFTCRNPQSSWVREFEKKGLRFHGVIHKPLADNYYYYDDRLKHSGDTFVELPNGGPIIIGLPSTVK